jgi:hypothetical protein
MQHLLDRTMTLIVGIAFVSGMLFSEFIAPAARKVAFDAGHKAGVTRERITRHNEQLWEAKSKHEHTAAQRDSDESPD